MGLLDKLGKLKDRLKVRFSTDTGTPSPESPVAESQASGDTASVSSHSSVQIKTINYPGLRDSFYAVKQYWGKVSKKNVNILPEQAQVFDYLLEKIQSGVLTSDENLRNQADAQIIAHFLIQWTSQRSLAEAAASPQATKTKPLSLLSAGASALASKLIGSSAHAGAVPSEIIITEDFICYLHDLFKAPLEAIRKDAQTNILAKLSAGLARLNKSPPELGICVNNERLSDDVNLKPCVDYLSTVYDKAIQGYDDEFTSWNQQNFFTEASTCLQTYYGELKKVNRFLPTNSANAYLWKHENLQQALSFYFDQGKYLYEIYAMEHQIPLAEQKNKKNLMKQYENYIKQMYAREETFTRTFGPLAFGFDKWTKIEAAMEQYLKLRGLPGEVYPTPSAAVLETIRFAGEQGRLRELKAQGLSLGLGGDPEDPFTPLNMPTRLTPIPLRG